MNQGNYGPPPSGGYGPSMGYQPPPPKRGGSGLVVALIGGGVVLVLIVIFMGVTIVARGRSTAAMAASTSAAAAVTPEPPPPPPAPKPPTEAERLMATQTLPEALTMLRPKFDDAVNDTDPGAELLAIWGGAHMKWSDVAVPKDETTFALALKDPDEARGKRLCVSGRIIQIEVDKLPGPTKVSVGLLNTNLWGLGDLFHFVNVGSSGTLVEKEQARMCGVVIGKFDYSNSGGGTGHALQIVGMFDLAENKADAGK